MLPHIHLGYSLQPVQKSEDDQSTASSFNGGTSPLKRKSSYSLGPGTDKAMKDGRPEKKKQLTNERREERNLREKERSLKITQQIHELRNLLSLGGVIVPKVCSLVIFIFSLPYFLLAFKLRFSLVF